MEAKLIPETQDGQVKTNSKSEVEEEPIYESMPQRPLTRPRTKYSLREKVNPQIDCDEWLPKVWDELSLDRGVM